MPKLHYSDLGRVQLLSAVGQRCPTALPFDLTELRKVRNLVTVQVVVVSKRFLVLTVITEILTLLTILHLEIAKTFGFTDKDLGLSVFVKDHLSTDLNRGQFEATMCQLGVFRRVFTTFVASQRSSAAISSLPAAMSFFAIK